MPASERKIRGWWIDRPIRAAYFTNEKMTGVLETKFKSTLPEATTLKIYKRFSKQIVHGKGHSNVCDDMLLSLGLLVLH